MVYLALIALLGGIACGMAGLDDTLPVELIVSHKDFILYALMFLVGISIGLNRGILKKIREYHIRIFVIPAGIIVGSLAGGLMSGLLTGLPLNESAAIASGMGWYSLAGVTLGNLSGAQAGSIAFLSNLLREIFSFFSIPLIAKKLNYPTCIAPAGATSEDTTLPVMIRYTDGETVVLSVFNGVLCSAAVPFLISFCYNLF
ncbi:MAG TPA: lysine exporter LysO family protein [Candidatus Mediterraneibacter merdipullorum]|nr:lysine exporter LysO family protein [Candidatus Mediterraneibacter merdipullorum]